MDSRQAGEQGVEVVWMHGVVEGSGGEDGVAGVVVWRRSEVKTWSQLCGLPAQCCAMLGTPLPEAHFPNV